MATSEKPWAVERQNSDESWSEVDSFTTEVQATTVANTLSWQRNAWHRARFTTLVETEAIKERTFFVPKPGEE